MTNTDLPSSIRDVLPEHAQDIYRAAFNHAWLEHGGEEVRRIGSLGGGEARLEIGVPKQ